MHYIVTAVAALALFAIHAKAGDLSQTDKRHALPKCREVA